MPGLSRSPPPLWVMLNDATVSPVLFSAATAIVSAPPANGTSNVSLPGLKPSFSDGLLAIRRPLTWIRISLTGSGVASNSTVTCAWPPLIEASASGETMRSRGTGLVSRSAILKSTPWASFTAASAEASWMARATISGRFRCWRSWAAVTNSASCSAPRLICQPMSRRACGRGGVEALRRPHHPFAVRPAEQGDEQLARLEVPQPHRLVG